MYIDDWFKPIFPLFITRLLRKVPNTRGRFYPLLLRFNGQVTLMHAHIFTYIHTYIQSLHTFQQTYLHIYIHTYMHTHIYTCMHAYLCDKDLCTMKPTWITIK